MPTHQRLIDVSHDIEHGMVTYRGLPAPLICDFLSRAESRRRYAPGTEFQIDRLDMVGNTGTYVDSPFHRFANGLDLAQLPLASLADLPAVVVRAPAERGRTIGPEAFTGLDLAGHAVLVHTGWDRNWRTDAYFAGNPFLTAAAARLLVEAGVTLVGIDSLNIDDTEDLSRPVHTQLLAAEIPIAEHLCGLAALPDRGSRFFAVPIKMRGCGTFPVRAFAIVD